MTAAVRTTTATVRCAVVYCTLVNLCLSQPSWTTTMNRKEQKQSLIVCSYKFEAEVIVEDYARHVVLLKLLTALKHRAASLQQQGSLLLQQLKMICYHGCDHLHYSLVVTYNNLKYTRFTAIQQHFWLIGLANWIWIWLIRSLCS